MSDKKRYQFSGEVTISVSTIVWATSEAKARKIAEQRGNTSGLVDGGNELSEWITSGDLDGVVKVGECELTDSIEDDEDEQE